MTTDGELGPVRHPNDKRVTDPRAHLHDKLLEAESMMAQWQRSLDARRASDAAEQLHHWRLVRMRVLQQIAELEREGGDRSGERP